MSIDARITLNIIVGMIACIIGSLGAYVIVGFTWYWLIALAIIIVCTSIIVDIANRRIDKIV